MKSPNRFYHHLVNLAGLWTVTIAMATLMRYAGIVDKHMDPPASQAVVDSTYRSNRDYEVREQMMFSEAMAAFATGIIQAASKYQDPDHIIETRYWNLYEVKSGLVVGNRGFKTKDEALRYYKMYEKSTAEEVRENP